MSFYQFKNMLLFMGTLSFLSCSMVQSVGVKTTASLLKEGVQEVNTEANYEFFKTTAGSNLKILESLWFTQQDNEDLLTLLIKGYGGFAFGVSETSYLNDSLQGEDESIHKKQALYHYTKAFKYGLRYFEENGISEADLFDKSASIKMKEMLDSNMGDDDMTAVFYFAQSWGGMINLQRDDVQMFSYLGTVKSMMDWVCGRDINFELGSCSLFYAVYEAGRPAMLGGSLENGRKIFDDMIKKHPYNLLARVSFIQFYIIPTMDEVLYAKVVESLNKDIRAFEGVRNFSKIRKGTQQFLDHPEYNLYNSIAIERLNIIETNKDEIF